MKNILQIFLRDIRKIKGNTIAMIMMIGILPTLYAWFNIGGSWDPYENTSGIKIAVASDDAGYQGDLLAIDINLGDKILTYFHENDEMGQHPIAQIDIQRQKFSLVACIIAGHRDFNI